MLVLSMRSHWQVGLLFHIVVGNKSPSSQCLLSTQMMLVCSRCTLLLGRFEYLELCCNGFAGCPTRSSLHKIPQSANAHLMGVAYQLTARFRAHLNFLTPALLEPVNLLLIEPMPIK
jgi:hypothetical protein